MRRSNSRAVNVSVGSFAFPFVLAHHVGAAPNSRPSRQPSGWSIRKLPSKRLHPNVLAIALANNLARIAWAELAKWRAYELTRTDDAGVRPA